MIHIRSAQQSDIACIMQVEAASFDTTIQETQDVFLQRITYCKNCCIVFEDSDTQTITGYFTAERWQTLPQDAQSFALGHQAVKAHCDTGTILYLSSFALLPQYRGKGVGEALFTKSVEWFCAHNPQVTTVVLLVNDAWKAALHIYQKAHFATAFVLPAFFTNDDNSRTDGIVMTRSVVY